MLAEVTPVWTLPVALPGTVFFRTTQVSTMTLSPLSRPVMVIAPSMVSFEVDGFETPYDRPETVAFPPASTVPGSAVSTNAAITP